MQFKRMLSISTFASLAVALPAATSTASCLANPRIPPPTNARCATPGTLLRPAPTADAFNTTIDDCADTCLSSASCRSFGFNTTSGGCQLYGKTLWAQGFNNRSIDIDVAYYAASCFTCDSSPTTSILSSSTLPTNTPITFPTTSATISTTTSTTIPTATSYPTCLEDSVISGLLTFEEYYVGTGYTHDDSSSSPDYPAFYNLLNGWVPADQPCAAITACAASTVGQLGYSSFDLHLVNNPDPAVTVWDPVWECVSLKGNGSDPAAFNVANSSIIEAYGFAVL